MIPEFNDNFNFHDNLNLVAVVIINSTLSYGKKKDRGKKIVLSSGSYH